ncbi:DUF787 family protein [Borrelia duttonii]|nr:DUF787 family protein [Borrelia duttonii]
MKLITSFVLTGTVSVQKDGNRGKRLLSNIYGLLNMPDQIKEEVQAANKDKMDKIFKSIKSGLSKLELGDYFDSPFMVLVDPLTSLKLVEPYAIPNASSSSNVYSSTDSWEDFLIKTIKALNINDYEKAIDALEKEGNNGEDEFNNEKGYLKQAIQSFFAEDDKGLRAVTLAIYKETTKAKGIKELCELLFLNQRL